MAVTPIPLKERIDGYLDEGRTAAESGRWLDAAEAWLEAAKLGSLEGANLLSRAAAPQVKRVADTGDATAQAMLAGILMDYYDASALPNAVKYATSAAEAGNPEAMRTLGFLYEQGLGVEKDPSRAAELWRDASERGDGYAAFNLAALHIGGTLPTTDDEEGRSLLVLAAERGVVDAGARLGDLLGAVDRDEEALAWIVWAAERGHVGAMFAAGNWYRDGIGTPPDVVQAMRWFFTMLDHGSGDGVHEAIQIAKAGAGDDQIREAAHLAGRPDDAEITIQVRDQNT